MEILVGKLDENGTMVYKLFTDVRPLTPLDNAAPVLGMRYGQGGIPWKDESFAATEAPDTPETRAKIQKILEDTTPPQ